MDGIIHLPLFLISSVLIVMAPGPDFVYVTTRGVGEGSKAGVLSALGISTGLLIHTMFAAFGLSAIIQSSMIAYLVIKFLGAGYLVYLGVKALINRSQAECMELPPAYKSGIFNQGVLTNVFNPKAIITFIAFLPQFVDERINNPVSQFFELGVILSAIAAAWFGIIGYFAGMIGDYIKRNIFVQKTIKYLSGTMMILLGLKAALNKD